MDASDRSPDRQSSREQPVKGCSPSTTSSTLSSRLTSYLALKTPRERTADAITNILREAILDGVLEPSTWLREEELARELACSRTPIREALSRLSVDGLVTISAHQGASVTHLSIEDVLDLFDVRERLEGLAARLAARHRSEQDVQELKHIHAQMEQAVTQQGLMELRKLNVAFHRRIRHIARNRFLDRFLTMAEQAYLPFGRATYGVPGRLDAVISEHQAILTAISVGDPEAAERCAIAHIHRTRELRLRIFTEGYPKATSHHAREHGEEHG